MRMVLMAALAASAFPVLFVAGPAIAADRPQPLFAADDVISLTLSGPINGISRDPGAGPVAALLKVEGEAPETLPVALSTRGMTRRRNDVCTFPPLRVEFTQKPGKTSLFRGQKRLKLVTHCQSPERYQQNLLLEYAAYRLYRVLTPESFNVRLARINYLTPEGRLIVARAGFFIEDIDDVAERNGLERLRGAERKGLEPLRGAERIAPAQLDPAAAARFAVFQYMISNYDWAMTAAPPGEDCCHNSRLIGAKGATTGLITVPYDFDLSGLVDAPYAAPPESIRVATVRERRYRGFCQHNEQAKAAAADLLARRNSLLAIVGQTPQLNESFRGKATSYLGSFFGRIDTPQHVAGTLETCLR